MSLCLHVVPFLSSVRQWREILKDNDLRLMIVSHTCYWTCNTAVSYTMLPLLATGYV